jgi:hypothetical protein
VELIFNFSADPAPDARVGDRQYHISGCFINGFNTAPILLRLPERQTFFGVQFKPLAVKKIFRTPASAFLDNLVDVTLIDRRNFHLFQPLLYQVATGGLSPANIASPLRSIVIASTSMRVDDPHGLV